MSNKPWLREAISFLLDFLLIIAIIPFTLALMAASSLVPRYEDVLITFSFYLGASIFALWCDHGIHDKWLWER